MYSYFLRIRNRADRVRIYLTDYREGIAKGVRSVSPYYVIVSNLYFAFESPDPVSNKELRRICREVVKASSLEHLADRYITNDKEDKPIPRLNRVFECYGVTEPDDSEY